jgi:hypothetical protein
MTTRELESKLFALCGSQALRSGTLPTWTSRRDPQQRRRLLGTVRVLLRQGDGADMLLQVSHTRMLRPTLTLVRKLLLQLGGSNS